jgi:hypothetical protein
VAELQKLTDNGKKLIASSTEDLQVSSTLASFYSWTDEGRVNGNQIA